VLRVHCAWEKFRELSGILTREDVSLKLKGKVLEKDMRECGLNKVDGQGQVKWRRLVPEPT